MTEMGWLAPSVLPASGVPTQSQAVTSYLMCNVRNDSWKPAHKDATCLLLPAAEALTHSTLPLL